MWTTNDIAQVFSVTPQTVRNWCTDFTDYLSSEAAPDTPGTKRMFTEDDVKVFVLIREMTQRGSNYDEVRKALADGKRGELPDQLPLNKDDYTSLLTEQEIYRLLPIIRQRDEAVGQLKQLQSERDQDRQTIERLNREIGKLEALLEIEREKNSKDGGKKAK